MEESTCSILEQMGNDGKQLYTTKYYNLDAIISVGFRVNTKKGIEFRQWANGVLKQYLLKGYAVNQRMFDIEQSLKDAGKKLFAYIKLQETPATELLNNIR